MNNYYLCKVNHVTRSFFLFLSVCSTVHISSSVVGSFGFYLFHDAFSISGYKAAMTVGAR